MALSSAPQGPATGRAGATVGLLLIAAGLFALAGTYLPGDWIGGLLFLGLGAAFLAARVVTGHYGYAPPAGILLGFGAFVALESAGALPADDGGWFFLLLGVGFAAVYAIGGRLDRVWPLYPATILAAFGAVLLAAPSAPVLSEYLWAGRYWPVALVAFGLWLVARPYVPALAHRLIGLVLLVAVVGYAVALGLAFASLYGPAYAGPRAAVPALAPFAETTPLEAPFAAGDTLRVNVTSGNVTLRAGRDGAVRATVTRFGWPGGAVAEPRLVASGGSVTLTETWPSMGMRAMHHDYVVDVPHDARVELRSASGDVDVAGLTGPLQVFTASGDVRLGLPAGMPDARVTTASGAVRVRAAPGVAAAVEVRTFSGDVDADGLDLRRQGVGQRTYAGSLGAGTGRLTVETASGDVRLEAER